MKKSLNRAHSYSRTKTQEDRKSTRLNSSHSQISYAVFCLKKKKKNNTYVKLVRNNCHQTISTLVHRRYRDASLRYSGDWMHDDFLRASASCVNQRHTQTTR